MCGTRKGGATVYPQTIELTLKAFLTEMRSRLERATSIAKAAEACALSGSVEKGVEVALDIEQRLYEMHTFLNVASMINRLGDT